MALKLIQGKQLNVNLTGSFTGSFSGSFNGTGSYATRALSASYALSSSFAVSSSRATTASFALTAPYSGLQGTVPTWNQSTTGNAATATTASFALTSSNISPAITNNVNNFILTATGGGTINGESSLRFDGTTLIANSNFQQGGDVTATGGYSHAEGGGGTLASGDFSHAEGESTVASGRFSHAEGLGTVASGSNQHVQGKYNISSSAQSAFIIGNGTSNAARSNLVFASGSIFQVTGSLQVAGSITGSLFGTASRAVSSSYAINATSASDISPAITNNSNNYLLTATGTGTINGEDQLTFEGSLLYGRDIRFQQGNKPQAIGAYSHAQGENTQAIGESSHAEGQEAKTGNESAFQATVNSGLFRIESGYGDITSIFTIGNTLISDDTAYDNLYGKQLYTISNVYWDGMFTVVEITDTSVTTSFSNIGDPIFLGNWKAAGGNKTISGYASHTEGLGTTTLGDYSHAEGLSTIALGNYQHVQGQYNIPLTTPSSFIHGNGTDNANRSNLIHAHDSIVEITGSLIVTDTITGNLTGTATNAISSSYSVSSSFATSASYAPTAATFPYTGSALITGSLSITGSLAVSAGITGSLFGTSSWAVSASWAPFQVSGSYATTASYAQNAGTASHILGGSATHIPFFKTDTTLATSSMYQSGSSTVIINQDNATTANPEALYVWQPHPTSFNVVSGKGNVNNYLQLNIHNTNQGTAASSDVVATADNGNETINYIDMGINSENFSGPIGGPNDAYLYSAGQHLHIGNITPNKPIQFFVGGPDSNADRKLELNANGQHNMTGSLEIDESLTVLGGITGSLFGTASWALNAQTASYAPSYLPLTGGTINGDVIVNGTASIAFLNVQFESASVIYSSGSNVFGDAIDDTQTLNGTVLVSGSQQITGSLSVSQGITGSLFGTSSWAVSASWAPTQYIDTGSLVTTSSFNSFTSSYNTGSFKGTLAGTASWALNASTADSAINSTSASHAIIADSALAANYAAIAGNGGVTSLIAGSGVTLIPSTGMGNVTIVTTGGGGTTIISGSNITSSFVNSNTWVFNHGLGIRTPTITVFDSNYNQIIPQNIELVSTSSATITFPTLESGFAVAMVGGVAGNALSASYSLYSTYAATASYFEEVDPVFVAKSGSFATTGSNRFIGNQTITGSLIVSSSNSVTVLGPMRITGSLSVTGSTLQIGNNTLTGNTSLTGSITVSGSQTYLGNLGLTGSLSVTGSTIQTGNNTLIGNTTLSGSINVSGSQSFKGSFDLTGSMTVSGSTAQLGNTTLIGNTTITGSMSLGGNILIFGDILPQVSSSYSLGSLTNPWKSIYVQSGSINIQSDIPGGANAELINLGGDVSIQSAGFRVISGSYTPFRVDPTGRTRLVVPNIPANDIGAFSIIGNASGSYQPVINPSGMVHVTGNDTQAARVTVDGFGTTIGAIYVGRHARGTAALPTPTLSGDVLVRFAGLGYATSSYFPVVGAVPTSLEFQATENYSTSSYGSRAAFYTYANGAVSRSLSAIIDATGITIPSSSLLFGTASWALNALTASYVTSSNIVGTVLSSSYALTASHALNVQIVNTGSFATTGSNTFTGNQIISGSLKVSGSLTEIGTTVMSGSLTLSSGSAFNLNDGFFVNGHKQFQYASFYHTASQTLTSATTPLPFQFSTIENNSGAFTVALSGSRRSRITTNTTGWWNIQYSAQTINGSSSTDHDLYTWLRINDTNVINSNNRRTIPPGSFDLLSSRNNLLYLASGSYFEIMYGADSTQVSFPYTGTGTSPTRPATPSISLVITQHA